MQTPKLGNSKTHICKENTLPNGTITRGNKRSRTSSCLHPHNIESRLPTEAEKEVKKLNVQLNDKDKQLRSLERTIAQQERKLSEYAGIQLKYKNVEKQYKRILSSNSSKEKYHEVIWRQAQSKLDKKAQRAADKLRRKELDCQGLHEEIERIEEEKDHEIESLKLHLTQQQEEFETQRSEWESEMHDRFELEQEIDYLKEILEQSQKHKAEAIDEKLRVEQSYTDLQSHLEETETKYHMELEKHREEIELLREKFDVELREMHQKLSDCVSREKNLVEQNQELLSQHTTQRETLEVVEQSLAEVKDQLMVSESKVSELSTLCSSKDSEISRLDSAAKASEQHIEKLSEQLQEAHSRGIDDEKAIEDLKTVNMEAKQKCDKLTDEIKILQNTVSSLAEDCKNAHLERESLQKKMFEMSDSLDCVNTELEESRNSARRDLEAAENAYTEILSQHTMQRETLEVVEQSLAEVKDQLMVSESKVSELSTLCSSKDSEISRLDSAAKASEQHIEKLSEQLREAEADKDELSKTIVALRTTNEKVVARCGQLSSEMLSMKSDVANHVDNYSNALKDCEKLAVRVDELNSCLEFKTSELEEFRDAAQRDKSAQQNLLDQLNAENSALTCQIRDMSAAHTQSLNEYKDIVKSAEEKIDGLLKSESNLTNLLAASEKNCIERHAASASLQNKYDAAADQLADQQCTIQSLTDKNAEFQRQCNELSNELLEAKNSVANLSNDLHKSEKELSDAIRELELIEKDREELKCSMSEMTSKFSDMQSKNSELDAQLSQTVRDLRFVRAELEETFAQRDSVNDINVSLKEENASMLLQIDDLNARVEDYAAEQQDMISRIHTLETDIASHQADNYRLAKKSIESQEIISGLKNDIDSLNMAKTKICQEYERTEIAMSSTVTDLKTQIRSLEEKIVENKTELDEYRNIAKLKQELELKVERSEGEQRTLKGAIDHLHSEKEALLTQHKELENELFTMRELLKSQKNLATELSEREAELRNCKHDLREVKEKYDQILLEHDALLGHTNKKQKIHYITSLKEQINGLVEENRRLREGFR